MNYIQSSILVFCLLKTIYDLIFCSICLYFETQVFDDEDPTPTKKKHPNYSLIDEETDEDIDAKNNLSEDGVWVNIDDLPWGYDGWENPKKYLDDEAEVDLENSDHYSERSIDDEDDLDGFIDDGTQESVPTDEEDDTDDV